MIQAKSHISEFNLALCPLCHSQEVTVFGPKREPGADDRWRMFTLCHKCGETSPQIVTTELKVELLQPEGTLKSRAFIAEKEIERELHDLEMKNMEEWIDAFATALSKNHILPMDF